MEKINVLVLDVPFHEGMAGTKRVKNLMLPLYKSQQITISNLAIIDISEKDRIGENGTIDGIKYRYVGYSSFVNLFSVIKFYRQGIRFIRKNLRSQSKNVIYYYGYPDLKNLLFILYAKFKNCKVIFDIVEDNRHQQNFHGIAGKIRNNTALFLVKQIPHFGDAIVVISNPLEKWLNAMYLNKIAVYNIPITVDIKKFENPEAPVSKENGISIFYGGSFAPKDGLEYLLKAFDKVCTTYSNLKLILTGVGQAPDMELFFDMVKHNEKVDYRGFLSTDLYYEALKSSDICCMTRNNSLYANAGFPFKLGEFLAAGKAIIATNVGDVPLYLENNRNALLISPESTDEIVNALILCIENKNELRQKLGAEARKTALEYFDDAVLSKKLFDIFESV
ncbi:glycosyltransferase family 4 protein [Ferruginibacter paludis]|uniref:glycosyltransferase family 4 protein n=1 Tax=Ferruginibacter paludis TaxID=1310417 RepID=UPI0025B36EC5|nr:glycosyltransferase family 4 protein [Ferruginibacter paludis]MDN3655835.1 glycosyltransferase family 4 protein [Ferruginibacter paludis]